MAEKQLTSSYVSMDLEADLAGSKELLVPAQNHRGMERERAGNVCSHVSFRKSLEM